MGIVVLNWNGRDDTLRCLRSLEAVTYEPLRVLVVDNGSTDGSVEAIRREHADVEVIALDINTGYATGNNVGITTLLDRGTEIIGVLNNDTVLSPGFLEPIVAVLTERPEAFVSPRIVHLDDPDRSWFDRFTVNPYSGVPHNLQPAQLSAEERAIEVRPSRGVPGAALFAHRTVWERVGLFDERYFLLFEDSDWSARARSLGSAAYCVTTSVISHAPSSSFVATDSNARDYYYCRNAFLYLRTHSDRPRRSIYRTMREELGQSVRALARERDRRALRKVAAQVEGIVDASLGRWSVRRRNWLEDKPPKA